jgi:hypothetical protein
MSGLASVAWTPPLFSLADTSHTVGTTSPAMEEIMSSQLGELDLAEAAEEAAGNWMKFECFVWDRTRDLDDAEQWCIIYSHHRDSGLLDRSNAAAIEEAMEPFTEGDDPDVVCESHRHWAVGWIDGFSIRVFRDGKITAAFQKYHQLAEAMPIIPSSTSRTTRNVNWRQRSPT